MVNIFLLKIIKPIWYFNLSSSNENIKYWADFRKLTPEEQQLVNYFDEYESENVSLLDASYQLWHKGLIDISGKKSFSSDISTAISLTEQYRFIRRMFKPIWVYFTLSIRLITFNNPLREIKAFLQTKNVQNINLNQPHFRYDDYENFDSQLVKENPHVSVIIPTLNRYEYLKNALYDLEKQTYKNHEVIIVDQSEPFNKDFYEQFSLNIQVIQQQEKTLWKARNSAIKKSKSEFILLFDDDSRIEPNWIAEHLKCLDFFKVDISAGVSISVVGAPVPEHYRFFRWADQLDTGNALIKKSVFKRCGLFDRQFETMRMGDGEFGARAYLNGFTSINNPKAKRIHLKVETGGLRQMGSWDGMRPKNWFAPRPIPSVLYFWRKYWGKEATIYSLFQTIPISLTPYFMKGRKTGYFFSLLVCMIFFPIILLQVCRSWRISSKMLREGAMIETL